MSSLQALLDAQEQRRGVSRGVGVGGAVPARGRGGNRHDSIRDRLAGSSSSSLPRSSLSTHAKKIVVKRGDNDDRQWPKHNNTGNRWRCADSDQPPRQQQQQQHESSPQLQPRWQQAVDYNNLKSGGRTTNEGRGGGGGGESTTTTTTTMTTYEQRRANIEQRAIEDSRNAAIMRSKRRPAQQHQQQGHDHDTDNDNNSIRSDGSIQNDFDEVEEDIQSLSSWVGPLILVANNTDGEHDAKKVCTYYQDREKRYPFYTDARGYQLLHRLLEANYQLLLMNHKLIGECAAAFQQLHFSSESSSAAYSSIELNDKAAIESGRGGGENKYCHFDAKDVIIRIGRGLYAHKPTLRTKGVTWSTEEYRHPGLARMYLRMKSIQRFTEIWCLLERSASLGVFDEIFDIKRTLGFLGDEEAGGEGGRPVVRIAAVGGGPGYELLATKLFFEERMPNAGVQLELTCMDICPAWRHYAEALGFTFVEYNIKNEDGINPLQAMGLKRGELHFCIVSCVMIYVTNDRVMQMFHDLVHDDGVKAILVSERGERTLACTMMEELGGKVVRLIDQSDGMDERQAIWCSREFADEQLRTCCPDYEAHQGVSVFPNVPYCEHKERRRRRPQSERFSRGSREYHK